MKRMPARRPLAYVILLGLILAGFSLTAAACDAKADTVKQTVNAYYDAVIRSDRDAETKLWAPDRQTESSREAAAWAQREKRGLKLDEVHVDDGPTSDQRIVHATISTDDQARPGKRRYESKVLILQQSGSDWRIKDVR